MRVVNFINQLQRTAISTSQIGGLVGPRNRVDNLKIEITVTARNWALDCPAHCTATTDWPIPAPQQKHEGHFKIQWYWSSINTLCFTRVMINIRHVNQTGSLLLYDLKAITNFISYPEETGSRLLWNTGNEIPQRAVSLPRTWQSSRMKLLSWHQKFMIYLQIIIIIIHHELRLDTPLSQSMSL